MTALLGPILHVLNFALELVQLVIIVSIVISWIDVNPSNPFVRTIVNITDPIYAYVRRWTKNIPGPLDWAPMVIILVVMLVQKYIGLALSRL